jgi:MFS family permease
VVEAPISVRQAFWSPYKRIGRMIGEQIQKFAASRDKAVEARAAAGVAGAGAKVDAPAAAPVAQAFDIAKFAGIFAAIGLALGALGTALAAVVTGFLSLPGWQMPLVVAGIVLLISGPSMLLAWLKLRQRNLGPLLDANGWAVNTRARINIPFGGALTGVAALPPGSVAFAVRPVRAEKQRPWGTWFFLLFAGGVIAVVLWRQGFLDRFLG